MLDYYSSMPPPCLERRILDVKEQSACQPYKHLHSLTSIVEGAVKDTDPGSYTGWAVFGLKEATAKAEIRLCLYISSLEHNFVNIANYLLAIMKLQRAFRNSQWSPRGTLYNRLRKTTRVGK